MNKICKHKQNDVQKFLQKQNEVQELSLQLEDKSPEFRVHN